MKKHTYSLAKLFLLIAAFAYISACQETYVESKQASKSKNNLEKESGTKFPDTFVHGYVTKNGSAYSGAKVELWNDGNLLPYGIADSPYSDSNGYYEICVCCKGIGTGYYVVKTEVYIKGDKWACSRLFYFDTELGPFDFDIDLPLAYTIEKSSD